MEVWEKKAVYPYAKVKHVSSLWHWASLHRPKGKGPSPIITAKLVHP